METMPRRLPWERLRDFSASHGAEVLPVSKACLDALSPCEPSPFCDHLAIQWEPKKLYVTETQLLDPDTLGCMVHELGHILAARKAPDPSNDYDFLGWEFGVAKLLRIRPQWELSMYNYQLDSDTPDGYGRPHGLDEYGRMSLSARRRALVRAIVHGKEYGNLDPKGKPLMVR